MNLTDDIALFLEENGFKYSLQTRVGLNVLCVRTFAGNSEKIILPLEITGESIEDAEVKAEEAMACVEKVRTDDGEYPLIITRDRWERQKNMMEKRLLSHLEVFTPIYARNCEIRRIDKETAAGFLEMNHSYGDAACRYRYGMFLKRHTGHLARTDIGDCFASGTLVAVATFSNARKWKKGEKEIRSYEWTRFASLPELRISGGMGRFLKHFIKEVKPDDIMTYSDLEWSEGEVYRQLGFTLENRKGPVTFRICTDTWTRTALSKIISEDSVLAKDNCSTRFFRNFGSNKFRLKLTDYE